MSNGTRDIVKPNNSLENYSWSVEHEHILAEWADKAMCYRWLHTRSNSLYSKLNAWYTIPCIIISTLAGTANFAQARVPLEYQAMFTMFVGGINILGGVIGTIQQFLKVTQLNEAHRVSSIAWDKFYRNIKIELTKHPNERIMVSHMLKMSKEEFDRLMETSPVIPDKIILEFKNLFIKSEDFNLISKPEICDVLICTEKFRNPWYTDEYQAKLIKEQIEHSQEDILKKVFEEKQQVLVVENFCKTFLDLHNREPTEIEVIDNLSENIDTEIIKGIISDLSNNDSKV
jgi:hypothetical protein